MRRRWSFPLFVVFGVGFAVAALGAVWVATQSLSSQLNRLKLKSAISAAVKKANTPTNEECRAFAKEVEEAFASGEVARINSLFDWDAVIDKALTGIEFPTEFRDYWIPGFRKGFKRTNSLPKQLAEESKEGAVAKFLKVRESRGQKTILFRWIVPTSESLNYFEFVPEHRPDGKVLAVDLHDFANSAKLTETFRAMTLPAIADSSRSTFEKLFGEDDRAYVDDLPTLSKMTAAIGDRRNRAALNIFEELHPGTKKRKDALALRCQAAQGLDDAGFEDSVAAFNAQYPDDPFIDLMSIDYYTAKTNYPKAISAIDRLDKFVGGDPYLDLVRAKTAFEIDDYAASERFSRKALDREPTLLVAYNLLFHVAIASKEYGEAVRILKEKDGKLNHTLGELPDKALYAEFRRSPAYRDWLAYIKERDGK